MSMHRIDSGHIRRSAAGNGSDLPCQEVEDFIGTVGAPCGRQEAGDHKPAWSTVPRRVANNNLPGQWIDRVNLSSWIPGRRGDSLIEQPVCKARLLQSGSCLLE